MRHDLQFKASIALSGAYIFLFTAAIAATFFGWAVASVALALSLGLTLVAMRFRCPACQAPLLKTANGWWTPYVAGHCRACGHVLGRQNKPQLAGPAIFIFQFAGTFFFFGFCVVFYNLLVGAGSRNELVGMGFAALYLLSVAIFLVARTRQNSAFMHGLGYICGVIAFIFSLALAALFAVGGDYARAIMITAVIGGFYASARYGGDIGGTNH